MSAGHVRHVLCPDDTSTFPSSSVVAPACQRPYVMFGAAVQPGDTGSKTLALAAPSVDES
jgi:hypothetical protein